jgi:hypothetical protein
VAYALGSLRDDLPDSIPLVEKGKLTPGAAARTHKTIFYRELPSLVLLDFDAKGMPPAVKQRLDDRGGFVAVLKCLCAGLREAGYIRRLSTSAGVHHRSTGEEYHLTMVCACVYEKTSTPSASERSSAAPIVSTL